MEFFKLRSFLNEIAKTRRELILLRRDLDERQKPCQKCGATEFNNSVSISLRSEIEEHEKLLRRSERKLTLVTAGTSDGL